MHVLSHDGKRFCTLQVAARCANGALDAPDAPRRGQPKLTIVFRGHGKRVSAAPTFSVKIAAGSYDFSGAQDMSSWLSILEQLAEQA